MKRKRGSHRHHPPISERGRPSGFIFICDRVTKPECFRSQVFGLPLSKINSVIMIEPGTFLFLFDYELRILYGVYRAVSHGGANLEPHAFGGKFPAQVKFQIDRDCHPLPESVFKHTILDNYFKDKIREDLDHSQVCKLLSLFQATTVPSELPPQISNVAEDKEAPPSGFIFMCDHVTKPECFKTQVFGLPMSKIGLVMRIKPGMDLFLFDCELKILYGVYRAISHGSMNLVPHAFQGKFPAQVKFQIAWDCHPLPESVFKHAIQGNYSKGKIKLDLGFAQVKRLLCLFQDTRVTTQPAPPVDSRHAYQVARTLPQVDPLYVPAAVPPPPLDNHCNSAPPNYSYAHAPPSSVGCRYYAAPSGPAPSNDQYHVAHAYDQAQQQPSASNGGCNSVPVDCPAQLLQVPPTYPPYPASQNNPAQLPPPAATSQNYLTQPPPRLATTVPPVISTVMHPRMIHTT